LSRPDPDVDLSAKFVLPAAVQLRHLHYFLAVSEELHFGHAAARLHIAQPPLSLAIRKLEEELGVRLLQRTSRVVTLTEAGRVFAVEARRALTAVQTAVAEARRAGGGTGAPFRVGCTSDLPIQRLLRFMDALRDENADLDVRIAHLSPVEQLARLRDGRLELGIVHHADHLEEIEQEPLFVGEPLMAYLPLEHPLAAREVLVPADLESETLIMLPSTAYGALNDRLLALLTQSGYRFAALLEAGGVDVRDLMLAVAGGLGIAVGAASLKDVNEAGSIVARRALDPEPTTPETVVVWRDLPPSQLAAKLASVRDVARRLRRAQEDCAGAPPAETCD
jgi:DNA-binding transcriptional LysR family regulator